MVCVKVWDSFLFFLFAYGQLMFSVSFVEKIIVILNCFVIFVKNQLDILESLFCSIDSRCICLIPIPRCFMTVALQKDLNSGCVNPPILLFFFKVVLAILGSLNFHKDKFFVIYNPIFLMSTKKVVMILSGIVLKTYFNLERMEILITLNLLGQGHCMSLILFWSYLISLTTVYCFEYTVMQMFC